MGCHNRPYEGSNTLVLPARHNDPVGCLHDQVCLTRSMDEKLNQAMFEIRHLCEQERETKRKIEDLEFLHDCQDGQISVLQNKNMDLEEELKVCNGLIEDLEECLGLGDDVIDDDDDDDDDVDDDDDAGNDDDADEDDVDVEGDATTDGDDENPEMLIP
jgi:hypothetical protein